MLLPNSLAALLYTTNRPPHLHTTSTFDDRELEELRGIVVHGGLK